MKRRSKKKTVRRRRVIKRLPSLDEFDEDELDQIIAEKSLHEFVVQAWHVLEPAKDFVDNWHIKAICEHLEAVSAGKIKQLLINVPPGTMKSLCVNVFWPAWEWGPNHHAEKRFMFSSYNESLSKRDSLKCRTLILSEWYQRRWPVEISEDQNTKEKFSNSKQGWRMIGSIGGRGIGEHPDYQNADDPENVQQAESDQERQNAIDWIDLTFSMRGVSRGVAKVIIMQRLHTQDVSGHVLSKGGWTHLCLPMRYELPELKQQADGSKKLTPRMEPTPLGWTDPRKKAGELLWPTLYPEEAVQMMEVNLGQYGTAGQLQQRPAPRGGGTFKRVWFEILTTCPAVYNLVRYWDKAGTKAGFGARTATVLMARFTDHAASLPALKEKFIILHAHCFREAAAERETIIKQTAISDQGKYGYVETWVEEEPGSGGKESAEGTIAMMEGFTCKKEKVTGSKEVRAEPMASAASVGKIKLLIGEWNQELLDELEHFPVGKLKDLCDSASGAYNKLTGPSESFKSTQGIRVGQSSPQTFVPDGLSGDDLDLQVD